MDISLVGIREPQGFDDDFNQGFPITEKENNEIEVPYYESDYDNGEDDTTSECQYETESDYASSDESAAPRRVIMRFNRGKPNYTTMLYIEDDFLPE
tara:strand:- start:10255 stop:10545 length:291 start_codon:yes stop_codon:yes gene_type:complete